MPQHEVFETLTAGLVTAGTVSLTFTFKLSLQLSDVTSSQQDAIAQVACCLHSIHCLFDTSLGPFTTYLLQQAVARLLGISSRSVSVSFAAATLRTKEPQALNGSTVVAAFGAGMRREGDCKRLLLKKATLLEKECVEKASLQPRSQSKESRKVAAKLYQQKIVQLSH